MSNKAWGAVGLTGGGTGSLDRTELDGDLLTDKDLALVNTTNILYPYWLDSDSGASESPPTVISPDANAGTKRWILQSAHLNSLTLENKLPVTQGGTGATNSTDARSNLGIVDSGDDVTLDTTSYNYLSLSGQTITLGQVDISDDTNLVAGTGVTLTGDSLSVDYGSSSSTACIGDDSRLSDSRTCNNTFDNATTSKTNLSLNNVENVAVSTWAGTTNVTNVGTIGTGTWNGDSIGLGYTDAKVTSVAGSTGVVLNSDIDHDQLTNFASNEHFTQASITATGTIATGVWNGTAISDAYVANNITLDNITQITTRSHTSLTDIGSNAHSVIDTHLGASNPHSGSQASGAILDDFNTLGAAASDGQFIVATGIGAFAYESGATARTSIGLGSVEDTALSTWAGTSSITTLGTVSSGTWNGTSIAIANGGTANTTAQAAIDALSQVSAATNEYVLTKDTGTGNAIWKVAGGGGGASTALDNLAAVAINTSLISDTDSTDNLGSTTKAWANLYVDTISSITANALNLTPIAGQDLKVNLSTTGDFIVNTDDLFVDTSTSRVGIGKTTPAALFSVGSGSGTIISDGISYLTSVLGANISMSAVSTYACGIKNASTTGSGLLVQGGSTAHHFALRVQPSAGASDLFGVKGDGSLVIIGDVGTVGAGRFGANSATLVSDNVTFVTSPNGLNTNISEASKYAAGIRNQSSTGSGLLVEGGSASAQYALFVKDYLGTTILFTVKATRNVGIGTDTFNSSSVGVLAIKDGTAPAAGTSNQTAIYSASGEGYWMDSSGNATLQTPHANDAPVWLYDKSPGEEQVDKSYNTFTGDIVFTNNDRRNKLVEMQLNGEILPSEKRFRTTETFAEYNTRTGNNLQKADWSDTQNEYVSVENEHLITAAMLEKVEVVEADAYVDENKNELKDGYIKDEKLGKYYRTKTRVEVEPFIVKVKAKQPPQWMKNKGIELRTPLK
jgi:hypothetical protein